MILFLKITGSTSTLNGTTKYPRKSKHLYHHWHRSVSDMRNVAKILSIVSARCESTSACSLCADFSSNVASVDAIPCILVSALQTYHRLTVDVTHFLASTNPRLSRNSTFCNLQDIDSEHDEERPLTTVSIICLIPHCSRITRYPSFISQDFFHFSRDNLNMKKDLNFHGEFFKNSKFCTY